MTKHVDGHFDGQGDRSLYWQAWLPSADPRAVVVIAHGAAEHSGRYRHVGEHLAASGFATYAHDHAGHGRSDGRRIDIGSMADAATDLGTFLRLAADRHPGAKRFLLGHSLGGAIALWYATGTLNRLAGLMLSGPAVDVSAVTPRQLRVAKLLSMIAPNLGLLRLDSTGVSRDPQVVRAYETDPLVFRGKLPARLLAEVLTAISDLPERLGRLELPLLLMHGTADRLAAAEGSRLVHRRAASQDKTLRLYDGLYHEILNEPEREQVLADLLSWMEART